MDAITPRGIEINPEAARPIEAVRVARQMLNTTRIASMATLDPSGFPYCTATNFAIEQDGTPFVFVAGLAVHARNIDADPRASIALADHAKDVMVTPRLTLSGGMARADRSEVDQLKALYMRRFPKSKLYLSLPDARLYRLRIKAVQLNGGPAQNANDVTPENIRTDLGGATDLMREEDDLVRKLNSNPQFAQQLAVVSGGSSSGRWRVTSVDPEGINLVSSESATRWWFSERATSRETVDKLLALLR